MDLGLKDKLVLVTGSGSGIGKATAQVYLQEGARVIVHDLGKHRLERRGPPDRRRHRSQHTLTPGRGASHGCTYILSHRHYGSRP